MRCRATLQIEIADTAEIADIESGTSDTVEVGTRTVDIEVTAEVAYDSVKDDYSIDHHVLANPHGWTWGDLRDFDRSQLDDFLCRDHNRRSSVIAVRRKLLDEAMGRLAEATRKENDLFHALNSGIKGITVEMWHESRTVAESKVTTALIAHGALLEAEQES